MLSFVMHINIICTMIFKSLRVTAEQRQLGTRVIVLAQGITEQRQVGTRVNVLVQGITDCDKWELG